MEYLLNLIYRLVMVANFVKRQQKLIYKHKNFSLKDTKVFTSQVLLPLEHLHSMGIVHRDLKLENLMLTEKGELTERKERVNSFLN